MRTMPNAQPPTSAPGRTAPSEPREQKGLPIATPPAFGPPPPALSLETEPPWPRNTATSSQPKAAPGKGSRPARCPQGPSWPGQAFTQGLISNPCTLILESEMPTVHHSIRNVRPHPSLHVHPQAGTCIALCNDPEKTMQPSALGQGSQRWLHIRITWGSVTSLASQATLQSNEIRISRGRYQAYMLF